MMMKCPVLTEEQAASIEDFLKLQQWEDNILSNMCRNKQILMGDGNHDADEQMENLLGSIIGSQIFNTCTIPKNFGRPAFNRYDVGDEYRMHSDAAFVGNDPEVRTDFAVTLFLSAPSSYSGGELILRTPTGTTTKIKEPAGTLVFYPAGLMHRVDPVASGTRFAFVGWVESHIQDVQKRDIMVEMAMACDELGHVPGLNDLSQRFQSILQNLYRQWMKIT